MVNFNVHTQKNGKNAPRYNYTSVYQYPHTAVARFLDLTFAIGFNSITSSYHVTMIVYVGVMTGLPTSHFITAWGNAAAAAAAAAPRELSAK